PRGCTDRTSPAVQSCGPGAPPLYYVTMPKGIINHVVEAAHAKGGASIDASFWGIEPDAFGETEMPISFVVDVREWVPRKLAALRCHRTQMGLHHPIAWIDEAEARQWLGFEYFRRSPLACSADVTALDALAGSETVESQI